MNEKKIQALAEQANLGPCCESQAVAIKKFAEAIVGECLVTLDSIVCDTKGERDTLWVARKVIADHFGVE